jgi:AcrR family transcriptional regulator
MTRNAYERRVGRPRGPTPDPAVRRAELLDAAERVIRSRGPQVGMDDIAAEIGLTKPVVYRSLGDKGELTAALGERVSERLADQLAQAQSEAAELRTIVSSSIDVFCRFVDEDTNLYRFIIHGSIGTRHTGLMDKPMVLKLGEQIREVLAGALELAGADPQVADTWAYAMLGAVFAATEHWLHHRHTTRAELVARLTVLLSPALEQAGIDPTEATDPPDPPDPVRPTGSSAT